METVPPGVTPAAEEGPHLGRAPAPQSPPTHVPRQGLAPAAAPVPTHDPGLDWTHESSRGSQGLEE